MKLFRTLLFSNAFALVLAAPAAAQVSAKDLLALFDKTTGSGYLTLQVTHHPAPPAKGKPGAAEVTQATLLFDRPDLFRFVLNPGQKNEFRATGDNELVRWFDLSTGVFGKAESAKVIEPMALALLGTAGELGRLASAEDVGLGKNSKLSGARVMPRVYGSRIAVATTWFHEGRPIGFDFQMHDGSRTFVAVLGFTPDVKTDPKDFEL